MICYVFFGPGNDPVPLTMPGADGTVLRMAQDMIDSEAQIYTPALHLSGEILTLLAPYLQGQAALLSILGPNKSGDTYIAVPTTRKQHIRLTPILFRSRALAIGVFLTVLPVFMVFAWYCSALVIEYFPRAVRDGWGIFLFAIPSFAGIFAFVFLGARLCRLWSVVLAYRARRRSPFVVQLPVEVARVYRELAAERDARLAQVEEDAREANQAQARKDMARTLGAGFTKILFTGLGFAVLGSILALLISLASRVF